MIDSESFSESTNNKNKPSSPNIFESGISTPKVSDFKNSTHFAKSSANDNFSHLKDVILKNASASSEQINGKEILIPADGNCLYTSVFLGFLLPAVESSEEFKARLNKIKIGSNNHDELLNLLKSYSSRLEIKYLSTTFFKNQINLFKENMGPNNGQWGGENEIKALTENLNIGIQEYCLNREDSNEALILGDLTPPDANDKKLNIINILRDKPNITEVCSHDKDSDIEKIKQESAEISIKNQHFRLIETQYNLDRYLKINNEELSVIDSTSTEKYFKNIEDAFTKLPKFCIPAVEIVKESPIEIIQKIYDEADAIQKKQACIRYLLQYQHYNANFTSSDIEQLNYPQPLCALQDNPGYIRTENVQLLSLIQPFIKKNLKTLCNEDFFKDDSEYEDYGLKINAFVSLCAFSGVSVLKKFFSSTHHIIEFKDFLEAINDNNEMVKKIIITKIQSSDLEKNDINIIEDNFKKIGIDFTDTRNNHPNLIFLFLLESSNIDCHLMWGAKWDNDKLRYFNIKNNELFGAESISLLSKCGATPDRLAVNQFITHMLNKDTSFKSALKTIGITNYKKINLDVSNQSENWQKSLALLHACKLDDDEGCKIYRDAILRWQSVFFDKHAAALHIADPLLNSQVAPWINKESTIIQWAKAYQNLCEIIMFCFEYLEEEELSFDVNFASTASSLLDKENKFENKSFGLYSYGMGAIFEVLTQILSRNEFKEKKLLITCISQNYFETLELIEKMMGQSNILMSKVSSLDKIKDVPNILVADIHPNDAAQRLLFENDIANWIKGNLTKNPGQKLILILDVTLNNLSDELFQQTINNLSKFIIDGQLEIFGIQSLAKLFQLGADNFSGGFCFYLGANNKGYNLHAQKQILSKNKFFTYIALHFQDINARYIKKIRQNVDWMYNELLERFSDVKSMTWIRTEEHTIKTEELGKWETIEQPAKTQFCATEVTLNVDANTVYVAINFAPLFDIIKFSNKEADVETLWLTILELVSIRGLPITGRQSFGFSLSSMNCALDAIRFSIGVESQNFLAQYADVIFDFSFGLSQYVANISSDFEVFREEIENIYKFIKDPSAYGPSSDDDTHEILFNKIIKEQYTSVLDKMNKGRAFWSYTNLFILFFQNFVMKPKSLYVLDNAIGDFNVPFKFEPKGWMVDKKSKIFFHFGPDFNLRLSNNKEYSKDKIFVRAKQFGDIPAQFIKLSKELKNGVFTLCVRNDIYVSDYEKEPDSVLLRFGEPKPCLNYQKVIEEKFLEEGLSALVNYLNTLDTENLPLIENQYWEYFAETAETHIASILHSVGSKIMKNLTNSDLSSLSRIKTYTFKLYIIDGMAIEFGNIIQQSVDDESFLDKVLIFTRSITQNNNLDENLKLLLQKIQVYLDKKLPKQKELLDCLNILININPKMDQKHLLPTFETITNASGQDANNTDTSQPKKNFKHTLTNNQIHASENYQSTSIQADNSEAINNSEAGASSQKFENNIPLKETKWTNYTKEVSIKLHLGDDCKPGNTFIIPLFGAHNFSKIKKQKKDESLKQNQLKDINSKTMDGIPDQLSGITNQSNLKECKDFLQQFKKPNIQQQQIELERNKILDNGRRLKDIAISNNTQLPNDYSIQLLTQIMQIARHDETYRNFYGIQHSMQMRRANLDNLATTTKLLTDYANRIHYQFKQHYDACGQRLTGYLGCNIFDDLAYLSSTDIVEYDNLLNKSLCSIPDVHIVAILDETCPALIEIANAEICAYNGNFSHDLNQIRNKYMHPRNFSRLFIYASYIKEIRHINSAIMALNRCINLHLGPPLVKDQIIAEKKSILTCLSIIGETFTQANLSPATRNLGFLSDREFQLFKKIRDKLAHNERDLNSINMRPFIEELEYLGSQLRLMLEELNKINQQYMLEAHYLNKLGITNNPNNNYNFQQIAYSPLFSERCRL